MDFREILKNYLLNEQSGLKTISQEAADILEKLQDFKFAEAGKLLRKSVISLDNLDAAQLAKLEKNGINVEELFSKAEKATPQDADIIAKQIDDAINGNSSLAAGEKAVTAEKIPTRQLSPEQQINKDFDALMIRADKLESAGQKAAAISVRKRAFQIIGEEFEESTKLPSAKAGEWSKLNTQRIELLKNPNTPKQITDDVLKQMDSIYPRSTWQRIAQWARENPKKAWLFGFLGAGAFSAAGYEAFKKEVSPKPKTEPTPTPSPTSVGRKCKGSLKRGCKGDNVKELQKKLINCGYSLPKKGADGIFGSETKSAVSSFQKDNGLKVDGIAGKETLKALESCKSKGKDVEEKPSTEQTPVPVEQTPEVSPTPKTKEKNVGPGFLERTFQDVEKMKKNPPSDDLTSRDTARKQWEEEDEKFKNFKADLGESKINKKFDIINSRNNTLEKLVFERLVKNAN